MLIITNAKKTILQQLSVFLKIYVLLQNPGKLQEFFVPILLGTLSDKEVLITKTILFSDNEVSVTNTLMCSDNHVSITLLIFVQIMRFKLPRQFCFQI